MSYLYFEIIRTGAVTLLLIILAALLIWGNHVD